MKAKNKININSIIDKLFSNENSSNLESMRKTLSEELFSTTLNSNNPFNIGNPPRRRIFEHEIMEQEDNPFDQGMQDETKTNVQLGKEARFPDCIININYQSGNIDSNGNWVVNDSNITYTFTNDFKYSTNSGESGTWQCNGNDNVKLGSANQQQTDGFPNCVTSFIKLNANSKTFYYSVGKNSKGEEVELFFTNTKRDGNNYLAIGRPINSKDKNSQFNLIYNCDNGLTITDISGSPYTIGSSTNTTGSQKVSLTAAQSDQYDTVTDISQSLGLSFVKTNYRLNKTELTQATQTIVTAINTYHRSLTFAYYVDLLDALKDFYTSMGDRYIGNIKELDVNLDNIKDAVDNVESKLSKTARLSNWNPLTNPTKLDMPSYTKITFDDPPFDNKPFYAYILKDQYRTKDMVASIQKDIDDYKSNTTVNAEGCYNALNTLLACIQYKEKTGLFHKSPSNVQSCQTYDSTQLKNIKQTVAMCHRGGIYQKKDQNKIIALTNSTIRPTYKVNLDAENFNEQP